jgi:hypothetical protein
MQRSIVVVVVGSATLPASQPAPSWSCLRPPRAVTAPESQGSTARRRGPERMLDGG